MAGDLGHFPSSPEFGSLMKVLESELPATCDSPLPLADRWFPNYKDEGNNERRGVPGPPSSRLLVEPLFFLCVSVATQLPLYTLSRSPVLPSQFQKLESPCFFAAGMQSCGPGSASLTHPRAPEIQSGALCGGGCVQGSDLLENTVANFLVLPGAQPDQFHQERPSGSPVWPERPPWCS